MRKTLISASAILLIASAYADSTTGFVGLEIGSASLDFNVCSDGICVEGSDSGGYLVIKGGGIYNDKHRFNVVGTFYNTEDDETMYSMNFFYDYLFNVNNFRPYLGIGIGYLNDKYNGNGNSTIEGSGFGLGFGLEGGILFPISNKFTFEVNLRINGYSVDYTLKYFGYTYKLDSDVSISHIGIGMNYSF